MYQTEGLPPKGEKDLKKGKTTGHFEREQKKRQIISQNQAILD